MPTLHQWDYLFAFGTIFATLDAFMIGANDVANSWATSVSSKSLTLRQAMCGAALFEFLGAVLVGARTNSTIKSGIVPASVFDGNAGVQLLGFTNAIFISSLWLTLATRMSWPVSTTYSIVAAVAGMGIAVGGFDAPQWGWNNASGLGAIWAGLFIAPALAAAFGAVCHLLVKFVVLRRKDSTKWALYTGPFWFFLVAAVCTMSIIYKGSGTLKLSAMSKGKTAAAIVLTATVVSVLSALFWLPYVRQIVMKNDYTLRWYHFFLGPLLWNREAPADAADLQKQAVYDYRIRESKKEELTEADVALGVAANDEHLAETGSGEQTETEVPLEGKDPRAFDNEKTEVPHVSRLDESFPETVNKGPWYTPKNLLMKVVKVITHGSSVDIHKMQAREGTSEHSKMQDVYNRAKQYPNSTEMAYSFVQVMTACTASFAHGANDLSNAVGPFSVIYHTWKTGTISGSSVPTPVWILVYGASTLVVGLALYGYNIMAVLGNRITLHSPSRGFCMELGAAITVVLASQYGIPVSTTMCITGATVGVSLCNFDLKSTNWRAIGWIYLGWIGTIIVVMIASACSMAIILNAPHF